MIGPNYGDFCLKKSWVSPRTKVIDLTQNRGSVLHLELREFIPPDEQHATDTKGVHRNGRNMYAIPWAIANADKATSSTEKFLDKSVKLYLDIMFLNTNRLVREVFRMAWKMANPPDAVRHECAAHSLSLY